MLLGAALIVLWLATQYLAPSTTPPPSVAGSTTEASAEEPQQRLQPVSSFRPGYVLAFLLLAGGGAFALYLRKKSGLASARKELLQPLARVALGPGQQLHLVACGDEVLVLGATGSQISLLKTLPAECVTPVSPSTPDATGATLPHSTREASAFPEPATSFADVLRRFNESQRNGANH